MLTTIHYIFFGKFEDFEILYKNHCFINPSSLGMPLENKPGAKYGILTIDRANAMIIPFPPLLKNRNVLLIESMNLWKKLEHVLVE